MNFSAYVKYICQKVRSGIICRLKSLLPELAKLQMVKSLILPVIYYGLPTFGNSLNAENLALSTKLENRALRFVYNLKKFDHISPYHKKAQLVSIHDNCQLQNVSLMHKGY